MAYVARNYATSSDTTQNLTVDVGSNAGGAIVALFMSTGSLTPTNITIDGQTVSALDSGNNGAGTNFYVAAEMAAGTGSRTVSVTWSSSGSSKRMLLMSFDDIDSVRGGEVGFANGSTTPSLTISTAADDIVTLQGNDGGFGRTFTASSPATAVSTTGSNFDAYETATGSSTTIDGTLNASANWICGAVALVPASAGDTTAPVLSSPTGTATGSTTATVGATTDEGNGTMYAFVSTSATPPSAADLKAGTGAVWSGSQAISTTGAKTFNASGLPASTALYAHLIHTDAAANDSNIVTSAQFTTNAAASSITAATGAATVSAAGESLAESTVTAAAGAATVSAVGGTLTVITSSAFKNNTGTVLASLTNVTAWVHNPTTGALVVKLTGQTTNASGVLTLNDAAIVSATTYRVVYRNEDDGAEGMETVTAS